MIPLDPLDVIALLEEGPTNVPALAGILGHSIDDVRRLLLGMTREGTIKRTGAPCGAAQHYALPSYTASAGRRCTVDREACRCAITLALDDGRELATEDLVLRTGYPRNIIKHECGLMLQAGQLAHGGVGRGSRWMLPGTVTSRVTNSPSNERAKPAARPVTRSAAKTSKSADSRHPTRHLGDHGTVYPQTAVDRQLEDLDAGDDLEDALDEVETADLDLELEEEIAVQPAPQPAPPRRAPRPELRQAAPDHQHVAIEPSWWEKAPREKFSETALQHYDRMRVSKKGRRSHTAIHIND